MLLADMLTMYLKRSDYEWVEEVYATREGTVAAPGGLDSSISAWLAEAACSIDDWIMEMEEDELLKKYGGPGDLRNKMDVGECDIFHEELQHLQQGRLSVLTELMVASVQRKT